MYTQNGKKELEDFKVISQRLLTTSFFSGIADLQDFLNYIDNSSLIINFILHNNRNIACKFKDALKNRGYGEILLPVNPRERNCFIYYFLKNAVIEYDDYYQLAIGYSASYFVQDAITNFNKELIEPFVIDICNFLEGENFINGKE